VFHSLIHLYFVYPICDIYFYKIIHINFIKLMKINEVKYNIDSELYSLLISKYTIK